LSSRRRALNDKLRQNGSGSREGSFCQAPPVKNPTNSTQQLKPLDLPTGTTTEGNSPKKLPNSIGITKKNKMMFRNTATSQAAKDMVATDARNNIVISRAINIKPAQLFS
jgi:hypothetical protein